MAFPAPEVGLVVSFAYLWSHEQRRGSTEGARNRPCVIVTAVEEVDGQTVVTVSPITHSQPEDASFGIEIPPRVKSHLGLDGEKSWVILTEVNRFTWPGYDLRPITTGDSRVDYGFLPPALFDQIKAGILTMIRSGKRTTTSRD
ncbi:type II toxin-antitoxin system PemK/MazF family toxin [Variovorax paradoxus]|nr:type II toxin-antitoxin system PemK/MazF family toxin [Variovorax paradoxus]